MDNSYTICLEQEILREMGADIAADFLRLMLEQGIDVSKREDPLALLYWKVVETKNHLFSKCDTLEDLKIAENQFQLCQQYINDLRGIASGQYAYSL